MASKKMEMWADQIANLLRNPPVAGACEVHVDQYNNRVLVVTADFDDDLSYAQEGEEDVIAVVPLNSSYYISEPEDG